MVRGVGVEVALTGAQQQDSAGAKLRGERGIGRCADVSQSARLDVAFEERYELRRVAVTLDVDAPGVGAKRPSGCRVVREDGTDTVEVGLRDVERRRRGRDPRREGEREHRATDPHARSYRRTMLRRNASMQRADRGPVVMRKT